MSFLEPAAFSDAAYDFLISAGFGFVLGIIWQLALAPFKPRRRLPAIIASCFFGAAAALFGIYFVIGRTHVSVMRWYIAAGMILGVALWRLAGWRLLGRALRCMSAGARYTARGLWLVVTSPVRLASRILRHARAKGKRAKEPSSGGGEA